jgi:nucleotide-binding universal stress UspA family protein
MSGIVCAIRGGPDSQPTIEQAIALAKNNNLPLYLLYVVNVDFLSHSTHTPTRILSKELHEMGEFILLTAQTTAETQGVTAHRVVREGNVGDEIIGLCREISADYVVLGRPQTQLEENIFTHDLLHEFSQRIEQETGARVIFTGEDDL